MTEAETKPKIEFKTAAIVLMALTSLWVATIIRLQNNVTINLGLASQRSRAEAVAAFGKLPNDASNYFWYTSFPWDESDNDSVLSGLMVLWYSQHPDMEFLQQGEFFLGGLAQTSFIPATYTDANGIRMGAYLVGMAHQGNAYLLVLQAPADEFEQTYNAIFDPMLRSLEIAPTK